MYITIMEDLTIGKTRSLSDDLRDGFREGVLDIIDISDPDNPKLYASSDGDKWEDIAEYQ